MKIIKVIMLFLLLFSASCCYTDTVTLNAWDVLPCDILTNHFGLRTPYQTLFFISDYISDIIHAPDLPGLFTIKTINGDRIPLAGRLMAVADVYDALVSKRAYKAAFSHERTREMILLEKGRHFDPDVVDAFIAEEASFQRICCELVDPE